VKVAIRARGENGFTLLELLVATAIFMVICGAIFSLLNLSQRNYSNETQMSGAFQEARLATDQMVRDFNQAGFPGPGMLSKLPSPGSYSVGPVAWDPGYLSSPPVPCIIGTGGGGTCATPGDFDLIIETQLDNTIGVQWIRYQLLGGTLYRSVVPKTAGDPVAATSAAGAQVPFLTNVMNQPSASQLAEINTTYPAMFPGGQTSLPIFQYTCDTASGTVSCTDPSAAGANTPNNIRDVDITIIVATPTRDKQTQKLKLIELTGRGHRLNPAN
jgi:prepilin-type N-terminal cleavage/methylation domain-containing protein